MTNLPTREQLADTEARHAHRDLLAEKDAEIERLTALLEVERKAVKAAEEGHSGTVRALEIILSRCKFDNQTANILKSQLGSERLRAMKGPPV